MTNVCILDNNALFKLNDGFSVVAPITVNVPFSITGNNKSCTALLNRCISSRNKIVLCPLKFYDFLLERKPPSTFALLSIPDNSTNLQLVVLAIILASEVFPIPGTPQSKTMGLYQLG